MESGRAMAKPALAYCQSEIKDTSLVRDKDQNLRGRVLESHGSRNIMLSIVGRYELVLKGVQKDAFSA